MKIEKAPVTILNSEIGTFEYFQDFMIGTIKEGVHVTIDAVIEPLREGEKVFGYGKKFIYISHRLHSYSIDPIGYFQAAKMFPNFKALVIVATNERTRMLANLERQFMKHRPIKVVKSLEDAMEWAETFLRKQD